MERIILLVTLIVFAGCSSESGAPQQLTQNPIVKVNTDTLNEAFLKEWKDVLLKGVDFEKEGKHKEAFDLYQSFIQKNLKALSLKTLYL